MLSWTKVTTTRAAHHSHFVASLWVWERQSPDLKASGVVTSVSVRLVRNTASRTRNTWGGLFLSRTLLDQSVRAGLGLWNNMAPKQVVKITLMETAAARCLCTIQIAVCSGYLFFYIQFPKLQKYNTLLSFACFFKACKVCGLWWNRSTGDFTYVYMYVKSWRHIPHIEQVFEPALFEPESLSTLLCTRCKKPIGGLLHFKLSGRTETGHGFRRPFSNLE